MYFYVFKSTIYVTKKYSHKLIGTLVLIKLKYSTQLRIREQV